MIEPIVLAFGVDRRYIMPMAVTLASALSSLDTTQNVHVYILHNGITEDQKKRLRKIITRSKRSVKLESILVDSSLFDNLKIDAHISIAAYFRLLLPDVISNQFSRAIYLDGDLLIRSDLRTIWEMDLENTPLAAVREYSAPTLSSGAGVARHKELGLNPNAPYFNSGLLVMDLARWRSEKVSDAVIRYLRENRDILNFHDQEGLNAVLNGRWKELDLRWNVPVYICIEKLFSNVEETPYKQWLRPQRHSLFHNAYIWHFVGGRKPWKLGCGLPGQISWLNRLAQCGWYAPFEFLKKTNILILFADCIIRKIYRVLKNASTV